MINKTHNYIYYVLIIIFCFFGCADPASSGGGEDNPVTNPVTAKPEIEVFENSNVIGNGLQNYSIGTHLVGTSKDITFTVKNSGNADLLLSNTPAITVTGNCFQLKTDISTSTITSGTAADFIITFSPTDSLSYTGNITIANNDTEEGNFSYSITGTGNTLSVPEISVKEGENLYNSGTDQYIFSNVIADGNDGIKGNEISFFIENTGSANLNITDILISGTNKDDFDITADFSSPITPSGNMEVKLVFDPLTVGTKNAVLNISSNDSDESVFTISLKGEAVAVSKPEINIRQGSVNLASGSGIYLFEDTGSGYESLEISFSIENLGLANLSLTGTPFISVSGPDSDMFSVTLQPSSSEIQPANSKIFKLKFSPKSYGLKSAVINIQNNDQDESNYTFTVKGTGLSEEINVKNGSNSLASGSQYDFGNVTENQSGEEKTFTIENTGYANLNLTGSPRISITGTDATMFNITSQPANSTILPGSSVDFKMEFMPNSTGSKTAKINIYNSDSDENPYIIDIKGIGLVSPPSAPGNLIFTQFSDSSIGIKWDDNSYNEQIFRIERKKGNGIFEEIATVVSNVTIYNDSAVEKWYQYSYRVRANNLSGDSEYSNEISVPAINHNQLTTPSGSSNDFFGYSISASHEGKIVVVGDPGYSSNRGRVIVYENTGSSWNTQIISNPNNNAYEKFGNVVEISGDRSAIIIGAPGVNSTGMAYVFYKNGSTWDLKGDLSDIPDISTNREFGASVDISYGANVILIGDPCSSNDYPGKVYLYEWRDSKWNILQTITSPNLNGQKEFGFDVSISGSGYVLGITSRWANKLYIYEWNGTSYDFITDFSAPGYESSNIIDIETSMQGNAIAAGFYRADGKVGKSGTVIVYHKNNGNWVTKGNLIFADDGAIYDYFGHSIAIDEYGDILIAGAYSDDDRGNNSGSVYRYEWDGNSWEFTSKFRPDHNKDYNYFGKKVAATIDGNTIFVGNASIDDGEIDSVYYYK